ncbi:leucine-rich repeat-containing protein [Tanacetum coccineum]
MRENIYFYFMHNHILFVLSLVLLWFNTTTATSHDHQLVAAAGQAVHKCVEKERQALLDFKAPLHDSFNRLSTWRPEEEDCCQWLGVTCDNQTGRVTMLVLYGGLEGEITLSLLNSMTHLTFLSLSYNKFTGTIPESIGNMTKLTYLDLAGNNFSGVIPRSIGSLAKLTSLNLAANNFSGVIPRSIGNLTNLQKLHLDSLRSCRVENLDWLSSLSSLEFLTMDGTSLAKANNWVNVIIGLQNLSYLSLVGCDLSHVMHPYSSSVNSSSSIKYLYLQKNNLNSPMYSWLSPLFGKKLELLVISGNKFDGNLSDFLNTLSTSATTLKGLDASSNQFTGSLSDEIQNFSFLKTLNLSLNQLNGTISDKLWQLPNLQELYLSSSSLTGAISENMLNLSQSIQYIDFSSNKLGPRFPKWIQTLKNLIYLDLSYNSISDTVSAEYWNRWKSSQLYYLDLSFNNISGKLPKSLSNHNLDFIDLSSNCFYGPIPAFPAGPYEFVDNSYIDHLLIEWQGKEYPYGAFNLQSFEPTRFTGNAGLCGLPTTKECPRDEHLGVPHVVKSESDGYSTDETRRWFYVGGATGFATGFWIVCSVLLLNRQGRRVFFHFHDSVKDWVYVTVAVFIAKWRRVARA